MGFIFGIIFGVFLVGLVVHYRKKIVNYLTSFSG